MNHSVKPVNDNSKRRYGVSCSGQFVTFDQTITGLFHGHVITWQEIGEVRNLQKEFIKNGLATKSGNAIIRAAKKIIKKG